VKIKRIIAQTAESRIGFLLIKKRPVERMSNFINFSDALAKPDAIGTMIPRHAKILKMVRYIRIAKRENIQESKHGKKSCDKKTTSRPADPAVAGLAATKPVRAPEGRLETILPPDGHIDSKTRINEARLTAKTV